jgi:glycerophosphoryl diester phosphodiesterase
MPAIKKSRRTLTIFAGALFLLLAGYSILRLIAEPAGASPYFTPAKFLVIAHRGGRSLGPESTLYTFQRAVDMGVDVLEMDLQMTRDGQLVVLHDATVDRTTNGTGPLQQLTLAQVKQLDAGYHWTRDHGRTFPFRGKGLKIPTLTEVFTAFPDIRKNIEIKDESADMPDVLCRTIREFSQQQSVLVASFRTDELKRFRRKCPEIATSCAAREATLFFGLARLGLESVYSPPAQALQVPEFYGDMRVVTRQFVAAAHQRNMQVHVWTVNDPASMQRLHDLGVDGIMTDYPDRLLRLLNKS